jgi:hypothetical protein
MKTFLGISLLSLFTIIVFAHGKRKTTLNGTCVANRNLEEPLLNPTKDDTVNYLLFSKTHSNMLGSTFNYEFLPIVRGLVDTALLNLGHFDNSTALSYDYKLNIILSPLIIEGEVQRIINEDTTKYNPRFYPTSYLIKITRVIKSKYKINVGDEVIAKISEFGFIRATDGRILYKDALVAKHYKEGEKYLFLLNKYHYMRICYGIKNNLLQSAVNDEYCPTGFSLTFTSYQFSDDYSKGVITEKNILDFIAH